MRNIHQDRRGVALLTVVLFFLVMVTLLGGLLFSTVNNLKNTQTAQKHTSVYYAAESGLNIYISYIQDIASEAVLEKWDLDDFESELINLAGSHHENSFHDNLGNPVSTNIEITEPEDLVGEVGMEGYRFVSIVSTGNIDNVSREVSTKFMYRLEAGTMTNVSQNFPAALITENGITETGNIHNGIIGPIASNNGKINLRNCPSGDISSPLGNAVLDASSSCKESVEVLGDLVFKDFNIPKDLGYSPGSFQPAPTVVNNVLDLSGAKRFVLNNLPSGSGILTIKLGGLSESDITILKLENMPGSIENQFKFIGTGRLIIYFDLKGNINLGNGNTDTRTIAVDEFDVKKMEETGKTVNKVVRDSSKLSIVMRKVNSNPYTLNVNSDFYGSVLTDADIGINWKNKQFYGYLVANTTSEVIFRSNSDIGSVYQPIYLYLPKAKVSLDQQTKVWGTIVSESYEARSPHVRIIYREMYDDYPLTLWAPLPFVPIDTGGEVGDTSVSFMIAPYKEN